MTNVRTLPAGEEYEKVTLALDELAREGARRAVVSPGPVDLLVDALSRLAADPELRRRWGEAGRLRVGQEYDIRTSARLLAQLFDAGQQASVTSKG